MRQLMVLGLLSLCSCDIGARGHGDEDATIVRDYSTTSDAGTGQAGCGEFTGCYTVYAHSEHVLYRIDLPNKQLIKVGPFNAPMVGGSEDAMTDLAVAPNDTIYVMSKASLYTADPTDGHVTRVGPVVACGTDVVGLTFMPDGKLYAADHLGAFCHIDLGTSPPTTTPIGDLGGGLAVAGDLVAVGDGTMYATVWKPVDSATATNNLLAKINPVTGVVTQTVGATGYPRLFGVAFDQGKVFGFTGDGSGVVVTIDARTGLGTLYGTFSDPDTGMPISFMGAGVNAKVEPTIY
jgi:hypothetical protein